MVLTNVNGSLFFSANDGSDGKQLWMATISTSPSVASISSSSGPASGGTSVTTHGSDLAGAMAVHFGKRVAGTIVSYTATQIVATSPPGSGIVDITVTTANGTSTTLAADQFTFVAAAVTGISPNSGPASGGTSVTITGSNLAGATAVHFGSVAGTIVSDTATQIVATSPPGSGTVDITVTTADGTSPTLAADQFTFVTLGRDRR